MVDTDVSFNDYLLSEPDAGADDSQPTIPMMPAQKLEGLNFQTGGRHVS